MHSVLKAVGGVWLDRRSSSRASIALALIGAVCGAPALAEPSPLPPLVTPATQNRNPGKIIFVQLITPDLAAAKTFYGGLFGWTFRDVGDAHYSEALLDGHPIGGIIERPLRSEEHQQPSWLSFISVANTNAAANDAATKGGKVLFGPRTIEDLGREAVLADPQGAVFAVLDSNSGDPPDVLGKPGEWIWSSLITQNPDTDAAFYQTLFGYDVYELDGGPPGEHYLLASGGYARASVNSLLNEHLHSHWLSYVRVVSADQTAAKVVALGGRVLVQPRPDRQGGKIAVVADRSGAPFGLIEWVEDASPEVKK